MLGFATTSPTVIGWDWIVAHSTDPSKLEHHLLTTTRK